jgi:hypothetical protein
MAIGDLNTGKSQLLMRARESHLMRSGLPRLDFMLQATETSDQERFRAPIAIGMLRHHGFLIVYDTTQKTSFDLVEIPG